MAASRGVLFHVHISRPRPRTQLPLVKEFVKRMHGIVALRATTTLKATSRFRLEVRSVKWMDCHIGFTVKQ